MRDLSIFCAAAAIGGFVAFMMQHRPDTHLHSEADFVASCEGVGFSNSQCLFFRYSVDWKSHVKDAHDQ